MYGLKANSINWYSLIGKLSEIRFLSYDYFRKTIFECMHLIDNLEAPYELS
jgi:hypothetical protein